MSDKKPAAPAAPASDPRADVGALKEIYASKFHGEAAPASDAPAALPCSECGATEPCCCERCKCTPYVAPASDKETRHEQCDRELYGERCILRKGHAGLHERAEISIGQPAPQPPSVDGSGLASDNLEQECRQKALEQFTAYFVENYPGPHTIINDPKWHAPKIFKAAEVAIRDHMPAAAALREREADREAQALAHEAAALEAAVKAAEEEQMKMDVPTRSHATAERIIQAIRSLIHPSQASALERREGQVREDERAACWEDFIRVIENAMSDAGESFDLTALREAIWLQGWALLGTGDGKPMHKRDDSMVKEWTKENRSAPASPEPKEKLDEA